MAQGHHYGKAFRRMARLGKSIINKGNDTVVVPLDRKSHQRRQTFLDGRNP
jgi:hypothetical protein